MRGRERRRGWIKWSPLSIPIIVQDLLCQELNKDQSPFSICYQFGVTKLQESQTQKQTSHIDEKASIWQLETIIWDSAI